MCSSNGKVHLVASNCLVTERASSLLIAAAREETPTNFENPIRGVYHATRRRYVEIKNNPFAIRSLGNPRIGDFFPFPFVDPHGYVIWLPIWFAPVRFFSAPPVRRKIRIGLKSLDLSVLFGFGASKNQEAYQNFRISFQIGSQQNAPFLKKKVWFL